MGLLIDATGGRAAWEGAGATLRLAAGFLTVSHDEKVVEQVEELVKALEEFH